MKRAHWEKIKGPRAFVALILATALGVGLFPVAPGTMGSLAAIPLAYGISGLSLGFKVLIWILVFALGTWAARVLDEVINSRDHSSIVIDEVIGMAIAGWNADSHLVTWAVAFALFRFFDILKPFPIRILDQKSKKLESVWLRAGGVMIDDVAAGFFALALISLGQHFSLIP